MYATATGELPSLADLPLRPGDPAFSAWGLWETPELGALNYLTDENTLQAIRECVKTGTRVGLNLALDAINPPFLNRQGFEKVIINKAPRVINDDIIKFNTQCSSQWDGFRHYAFQQEGQFYHGATQHDIHDSDTTTLNGMQSWAPRGIAGRGVLVDYDSWATKNNTTYDRLSSHAIHHDDIISILKENNVVLQKGDILLLRTGFLRAYRELDAAGKKEYANKITYPGLRQSAEALEWLWGQQFAAVAADNPAFEVIPTVDESFGLFHPILIAGWGTTIGELFDLDSLSEECKRQGRYTVFLSSSPLNYTGAVASPPNIMAIL